MSDSHAWGGCCGSEMSGSRKASAAPERVRTLERLELLRCVTDPDACADPDLSGRSGLPTGEGAPPLLFVHGAFSGAWCWAENFLPYFAGRGFDCYALSLRGHGESAGYGSLVWHSVAQYVEDLAEAVECIGRSPVVIGHSMGGLLAQKYLERAPLPGIVLLASVPPQGLFAASLSLAMRRPVLFTELNMLLHRGSASMESMRDALFAGPVALDRLRRYYRLMQPESTRAIWDMTFFDLPQRGRMRVPPMLVLGAERDLMVPQQQVYECAQSYCTEAEIFPGMGHAMMLEAGWQKVADRIIDWLRVL